MTDIHTILFDNGGIFVQLDNPPPITAYLPSSLSASEVLERWLHCEAGYAFEAGLIDTDTFITQLINEFDIKASPEEVLHQFTHWPGDLFPGTEALLNALKGRYPLVLASNANEIHWKKYEPLVAHHFDHLFISFQMGVVKPSPDYFLRIIEALKLQPEQLLFLDDSKTNVQAARKLGIQAHHVVGCEAAREKLIELQLL